MGDYLGYFLGPSGWGDIGVIAVRDSLPRDQLLETLIEEWAHARTHGLGQEDDGLRKSGEPDQYHHPTFWAEYGRIQVAARGECW